jgi:hypothetical protein
MRNWKAIFAVAMVLGAVGLVCAVDLGWLTLDSLVGRD